MPKDPLIWNPPATPESIADQFLVHACVDYHHWNLGEIAKAQRILHEHPEVASESVYGAAAAGDVEALRRFLAADATLVDRRGGPHQWEPLLYACYSRLDAPTLDAARVLLEAGADPNAGFLWMGNLPPSTALTGAFGDGEGGANNPPHPRWRELVRLLLDAGADPNDGQTLYNRHWRRDNEHLEILFSYGLGTDERGPWYRRYERLDSPRELLIEELWIAARQNNPARVKLLIDHGADVNARGRRDGRTPYEAAIRAGNDEIAEYLLQRGATKIEPSPDERFAAACINGRRAEALAMIEGDPSVLDRLGHHGRVELLHRAVEADRPEGIRLMAELGFPLGDTTKHDGVGSNLAATPMHNAAWGGKIELVQLLLDLGADPTVRDPSHHGTPIGWAAYNKQQQVVDLLLPRADIFDAVWFGAVERAAELLHDDPSLARAVDARGNPLSAYLNEQRRYDEMAALLREHGAAV